MIQTFEFAILDLIQNLRCDFLDSFMPFITSFGNRGFIWIVIGIIMCVFKKSRKAGAAVLLALLVGYIFGNMVLKNVFARQRPCWINDGVDMLINMPHDFSFPSGHTLSSFVAAFTIYFYNKKIGVLTIIFAALIAFSRLYLYVHFPSDVLGGIAIAFIIAFGMKKFFKLKN